VLEKGRLDFYAREKVRACCVWAFFVVGLSIVQLMCQFGMRLYWAYILCYTVFFLSKFCSFNYYALC
jgi:hypothetical protein